MNHTKEVYHRQKYVMAVMIVIGALWLILPPGKDAPRPDEVIQSSER